MEEHFASKSFTLISCLALPYTLKMEGTCSSETPIEFKMTIWHYIQEDRILYNHSWENLKSCIEFFVFAVILFPEASKMGLYLCIRSKSSSLIS
jgi:hypothetical protein